MNIEIKQTPNTGPPFWITWAVVLVMGLIVLWWGVVWFCFALLYTIAYFRWARRRYPKT